MAVVLGFEEPDPTLLVLSGTALLVPVLAAFVHLAFTAELTRGEKRAWLRELVGRQAPLAWASYLACLDRRAAANGFAKQKDPH